MITYPQWWYRGGLVVSPHSTEPGIPSAAPAGAAPRCWQLHDTGSRSRAQRWPRVLLGAEHRGRLCIPCCGHTSLCFSLVSPLLFFFTMAVRCFYESILKDSRWFWETETRTRCKWILGVVSEPNRSTGLPKHRFTLWQRECGIFFFLGRSCCSVTALTLLQFLVYVLRWFVTKPSGCICAGNPHGWYSKQLSIFYMCSFLSCNSCEDNCII